MFAQSSSVYVKHMHESHGPLAERAQFAAENGAISRRPSECLFCVTEWDESTAHTLAKELASFAAFTLPSFPPPSHKGARLHSLKAHYSTV